MALLALLSSASSAQAPPTADSLQSAIAAALASVLAPSPSGGYGGLSLDNAARARTRSLYQGAGQRLLWLSGTGEGARADALVDALLQAPAQALRVDGYGLETLAAALVRARTEQSAAALADADVRLTAAFVAYGTDLLIGQVDPGTITKAWHIDPQQIDVGAVLASALDATDLPAALLALRPQDASYAALTASLAEYRGIVDRGGWPAVPDAGVVHPGDTVSAGFAGALLGRLSTEGYLAVPLSLRPAVERNGPPGPNPAVGSGTSSPVIYDSVLSAAVLEYQRRHALAEDAIIGPATRRSMNRSANDRLRQIAANLERHRWLPRERGARHVIVNVPAFRLRAYDAGREVLSMNVVVGAEYDGRSTPVFSDSMAYVVFRPYWNVPQGIAARELWPKQRADAGYFARNGYESVRASWGSYVRQKPGGDNALGLVKFIFPNDFAIYLHDTPAQALFAERVRAASHGCIRVEHPDALARFVLGWDPDRIQEAMHTGRDNQRVNLDAKLPVYIVYLTAYAGDGKVQFADDIYHRDAVVMRAISAAAFPSDDAARAIQAMERIRSTRRADGATPRTDGAR
ncbi:MAG: L,D-transpeptidase family protein [Gemmatimonas sp.]